MMDYKLLTETREAYNKLKSNSYYIDEIRPFLLVEVREFAVQISMRKLDIWDRFCQIKKNVEQSLPYAKEAGYGEDVLKYHLDRDSEFTEAERVIKLIDDKSGTIKLKVKKPCNSIARARAFCILMLPDVNSMGKKDIMANVKRYFPDQSGQTIYKMIRIDGLNLDNKEIYQSDYDYALKLFNEI